MNFAFYPHPIHRRIAVVFNPKAALSELLAKGYHIVPALTREAFDEEARYLSAFPQKFHLWEYEDFDELLDDEWRSGTPDEHLDALLELTRQVRIQETYQTAI